MGENMRNLTEWRQKLKNKFGISQNETKINIGMGTCGIAAGAENVKSKLEQVIAKLNLNIKVGKTSCMGICYSEVNVEIELPEKPLVIYGRITEDKVERLIESHVVNNQPIIEWAVAQIPREYAPYANIPIFSEIEFNQKQVREITKRLGLINPESIEDYLITDGYIGLENTLQYTPEQIIEKTINSGLRGRGGGGFPTGLKWKYTKEAHGGKKYIICNADEGDPGAFMDRSLLEGDPHAIIEGMIIAGYAIGADEGYIYVRAEYPLAIKRLQIAIDQALAHGLLGENILNSNFSFYIHIKMGAGAFVCGEETALIQSIEGKRGMPRIKPPFPAERGLWGKPTSINNVETFANVSLIFRKSPEWYASIGTTKSKGTKVFSLTGKINKTGLAEVPMGTTLHDIIFEVGGGIQNNKNFKAVQIGGPSGGCLPKEMLHLPVDYDSLVSSGAMMGSGGLVIMDEETCMVDVAKFFLNFSQKESCGKCTPCREGTKRMYEILDRITKGEGKLEDLETLERLGKVMKTTSLCGLGQTAPNPVLSTLHYFRDEYIAHIVEKRCPAGTCTNLIKYTINPEKCIGCTACAKVCPVGAISGKVKHTHYIDPDICIKCGACIEACRFQAISKG